MPEIDDGETVEIQGSAKDPYILRNVGGVHSCSCPAWRNQSTAIERRTCKHLRQYCGQDAEKERLGGEIPTNAARPRKASTTSSSSTGGAAVGKPLSKYEVGRSFSLLKVKSMHDAEAIVLEHLPGTGRHKGRLGALSVELANGTKFAVGTGFSDAERDNPPPIGGIITFRYQELSDRGVPRFPAYVRLRTDIDQLTSNIENEPAGVKVLAGATSVKTNNASMSGASPGASGGPSAPQKVTSPSTGSTAPRMFEFSEGTSSKFWEVVLSGNEVTVRFGKIGTAGQSKPKPFPSAAAAKKYYDDLIIEKTGKGYVEVGDASGGTADD